MAPLQEGDKVWITDLEMEGTIVSYWAVGDGWLIQTERGKVAYSSDSDMLLKITPVSRKYLN